MADQRRSPTSSTEKAAIAVGLGLAATAAGAFLLKRSGREEDKDTLSDAPHWTLEEASQGDRAVSGKTLLIGAPREKIFQAWRDVQSFPRFMENVEKIERLDGDRSRWTIKAPAGKTVTMVNRITEVRPGEAIYWQSEPDSDIENSGKLLLKDAPAGRGTYVSLILSYAPPGGSVGRLAAKLFQREPEIQARRDLRRFKQLIETGEVTTNASPSARSSEMPTEAHI